MLEKLKTLYPNLNEELLQIILEQSEQFILNYCNIEEVPQALEAVAMAICIERINKLKSEGINSESAGGSSISYMEDYSAPIYRELKRYRKVRL